MFFVCFALWSNYPIRTDLMIRSDPIQISNLYLSNDPIRSYPVLWFDPGFVNAAVLAAILPMFEVAVILGSHFT